MLVRVSAGTHVLIVVESSLDNKGLWLGVGVIDGSRSSMITLLIMSDKFLKLRAVHCCGTGVKVEKHLDEAISHAAEESYSGTFSPSSKGNIGCVWGPMVPRVVQTWSWYLLGDKSSPRLEFQLLLSEVLLSIELDRGYCHCVRWNSWC